MEVSRGEKGGVDVWLYIYRSQAVVPPQARRRTTPQLTDGQLQLLALQVHRIHSPRQATTTSGHCPPPIHALRPRPFVSPAAKPTPPIRAIPYGHTHTHPIQAWATLPTALPCRGGATPQTRRPLLQYCVQKKETLASLDSFEELPASKAVFAASRWINPRPSGVGQHMHSHFSETHTKTPSLQGLPPSNPLLFPGHTSPISSLLGIWDNSPGAESIYNTATAHQQPGQ
ncbi:hypothetical protein B0J11DRAFT_216060 [Dendryphion nanum]|uniref:Uncharacterized protein n=1 Tax=Dendryphion nanum TaxID=256645 RepID=A0A9P9IR45_9PLEO|nr:hypothetical protein B0J11DRAFT_216060 [Dendryphion nanum]